MVSFNVFRIVDLTTFIYCAEQYLGLDADNGIKSLTFLSIASEYFLDEHLPRASYDLRTDRSENH